MASIHPATEKVNYAEETFDSIMNNLHPDNRRILDGLHKWQTDIRFSDAPIGRQPLLDAMRMARGVRVAGCSGAIRRTATPNTYHVHSENGHEPYTVETKPDRNRGEPMCNCADWEKQARMNSYAPGPHSAIWCKHTIAVKIITGSWDAIINRFAPPPPRTPSDDWAEWADMINDELAIEHAYLYHPTQWQRRQS
jgi:hypothetical protein